jgi:predicted neutral ceramidase superfamily lipid hydrolase
MAGLVFMWFDSRNEAREGMVEVAGAMAFALLPAAFGTLAGWRTSLVLALAAIMLARAVPTVMFVRTYVRSNKGRAVTRLPAMIAAGVGLILTAWLVHAGLAPWPAAAFALLLIARAAWLLGPLHPRLAAKTVGMTEMAWGVATVLTVAIAWRA